MNHRASEPISRFYEGPVGQLDARLHGPSSGAPVVICHPHPQFGGTMGSRLVHDLATALGDAGYLAVRFNYRGVGRSEGSYGQGEGEVEDAISVLAAVAAETKRLPILVGYSFGGAVACRVAASCQIARLVLVGTPLRLSESKLVPASDAPSVSCPTVSIVGDHDGFVPVSDAQVLAASFVPPARLVVLAGAAHFLEPSHNPRVVAAVLEALSG